MSGVKIWHNNKIVDQLIMSSTGASWLMGDGAFETIRTYSGVPFELELHLQRLIQSLTHLVIPHPDLEQIESGVFEVIRSNPAEPYGRLRISVFADGDLVISHQPYEVARQNDTLAKYPEFKHSKYSIAKTKSASYAENFRAIRLAKQRGYSDSLFINERGEVVESALANVIYLIEGHWFTPPLESGCLPGVTRGLLVEHFGLQELALKESELGNSSAVALVSSLREISTVERYESNLYPSSKELAELQTSFSNWIRDRIRV